MSALRYGTVDKPTRRVRPQRIDFRRKHADKLVAWYGKLGKSVNFIMKKTEYTYSQVIVRLQKAGISISAERNGDGDYTQMMMHNPQYKSRVMTYVERHVPDPVKPKPAVAATAKVGRRRLTAA